VKHRTVVIRGRLVGPTTVELDEPVPDSDLLDSVEVLLRIPAEVVPGEAQTLIEFLQSLPPGVRSKDDIDRQLADERASWSRS
jgi:hypothetical protein